MAKRFNYIPWLIGGAALYFLFRKPGTIQGIGNISSAYNIKKELIKIYFGEDYNKSKSGSAYGFINDWGIRISNHQILSYSRGTKVGEDIDIVQDDIYPDEFNISLKDSAWNAFHHVVDLLSIKDADGDDTQNLKYEDVIKFKNYITKINKYKF